LEESTTRRQHGGGGNEGLVGDLSSENLETITGELADGIVSFAFHSSLSALSTVFMLFGIGDHILTPQGDDDNNRRLKQVCRRWGISYDFVDTTDLAAIQRAVLRTTRAIVIKSPAQFDRLEDICSWAKKNDIISIVKHEFVTPQLQQSFEFGADIVYGETKFLTVQKPIEGGLILTKNRKLADQIDYFKNIVLNMLDPQDCWLTIHELKTFSARMSRARQSVQKISARLKNHPKIKAVYYPEFSDLPEYELMNRHLASTGTVLFFEVETAALAQKILHKKLQWLDSIQIGLGKQDIFLRLSVGVEDPDDLLNDLFAAMEGL